MAPPAAMDVVGGELALPVFVQGVKPINDATGMTVSAEGFERSVFAEPSTNGGQT
jgi:hypothetical protein